MIVKKASFLVVFILFSSLGFCQINPQGVAPGLLTDDKTVLWADYPLHTDHQVLLQEDEDGIHPDLPFRVAVAVDVNKDFFSLGEWMQLPDGRSFYRLGLSSEQAKGIGVAFNNFYIPEHAQLFFYSPDKTEIFGGYTHHDNHASRMFPGPVVSGDAIIIEYFEPDPHLVTEKPELHILDIAHYYRPIHATGKNHNIGSSDWCHININCSEGDNWQVQKRGVARMTTRVGNSWGLCSGSLVNNTAQDGRPYFLTAEHCGGSASANDRNLWTFRFNFERPGCEDEGFPPNTFITGCSLVAKGSINGGSDMQLVELNFVPPPAWQPYYNGWDIYSIPAHSGVSIHHPSGDVKKISTFSAPAVSVANPVIGGIQMAAHSAWDIRFVETENGHSVTQGGSSGSPMFNQDGLIVGTLTGGSSSCTWPQGSNIYGKMNFHWESNASEPSAQLKPWLDPLNTGQISLAGLDIYPQPAPEKPDAMVNEDLSVTINWDLPAYISGDNWFANVLTYSSVRHEQPERAVMFDLAGHLQVDTFYIKKLSHLFWEHPQHPWETNNAFRFKIYGKDSETPLYESEEIIAHNFQTTNQVVYYDLSYDVAVADTFFVAVAPVNTGQPSSLALEVALDSGNSFYGTGGNWQPLVDDDKEYDLLINIYGSDNQNNNDEENDNKDGAPGANLTRLGRNHALLAESQQKHKEYAAATNKLLNQIQHYNIYRDGVKIDQTSGASIRTYTDLSEDLIQRETYSYQVSAVYNLNPPTAPEFESEKSEPVEVTISLVGINETDDTKQDMLIYPNPAYRSFTVTLPEHIKTGNLTIKDINGRTIMSLRVDHGGALPVRLDNESPGIYFVEFDSGKDIMVNKLILF